MTTHRYATPLAFKTALEQRLRTLARDGSDLARRRQLLIFERLLARFARLMGPAMVLKGGLALELRLTRARATRDVDLRFSGPSDGIHDRLRAAGELTLDDFLRFELRPDHAHPTIQSDGMRYEGLRLRASCSCADKQYGSSFGVDVAFADPILGTPDEITAPDTLAFAGIAPAVLRVYPIETHLAEKLHAYTLPRTRPNSRVKDLPDLALLASIGSLQAERVRAAVQQTFTFRATHPPPTSLPDPPAEWALPYARLAAENLLPWSTLAAVTAAARDFLDPVLAGRDGLWSSERWAWL
jgi:predicted nucleotidyltransferase component of viral defense system